MLSTQALKIYSHRYHRGLDILSKKEHTGLEIVSKFGKQTGLDIFENKGNVQDLILCQK